MNIEKHKHIKKETNEVLRSEKYWQKLKNIKTNPEDALARLSALNEDINHRLGF